MRVLLIGDEILSGRIRDANLQAIARAFSELGLAVRRAEVLPDAEDVVADAVSKGLEEGGAVITSGGLGPTPDDKTRKSLARALGLRLEFRADIYEKIRARLAALGHPELEIHRNYAMIPRGFVALPNPVGIAPGLLWREKKRFVLALPGPPAEVSGLLPGVLRALGDLGRERVLVATLAVAGLREADIAERVSGVPGLLERIAFYPRLREVILKIKAESEEELKELVDAVLGRLGDAVYSQRDEGLEASLGRLLKERGLSVATGESCTGGLVAHLITQVPGASDYFRGGGVVYSPGAKSSVLGLSGELIAEHSVYSHEVARAMARGAARVFGADLGLSSTCVAGPGPSEGHPPGQAFLGVFHGGKALSLEFSFGGSRDQVKLAAAKTCLEMGYRAVLGMGPPPDALAIRE